MKSWPARISNRLAWLPFAAFALGGLPALADPEPIEGAAPTASELLPSHLREGLFHVVEEEVETDGFTHVFTLRSHFGEFRVHGGDLLVHRVAEIDALVFLLEWEAEESFVQAAERAGPPPRGVPPGAHADFEASRRELAHVLGVDPYGDTQPLRDALHRIAWVVEVAELPLPAADPTRSPAHGANARVHGLMRDHPEDDLERLNRIELAVMGVPEETREAFLDHPEYSAHHETALVDALAAMEDTRARHDFIDAALSAESRVEARRYRRAAEMMREYHEQTASLHRIEILDGHPTARSVEGVRVAPVRSDHATWTSHVERLAERLADPEDGAPGERDDRSGDALEGSASDEAEGGVHILFDGSLSEQVRRRLEAMGHRVDSERAPWAPPASRAPDASGSPQ